MPTDTPALPPELAAVRAQLEAGDCDGALATLGNMGGRAQQDAWARHLQGVALLAKGAVADAADAAEQAATLAPNQALHHLLYGVVLSHRAAWPDAERALGAAIEAGIERGEAWRLRGEARFRQGRFAAAAADFRAACERMPERAEAQYNLAVALAGARRWPECEAVLAQCAAAHPDWAPTCGQLLVEAGRLQATDEAYSHVHRIKNLVGMLAQRAERLATRISASLEPDQLQALERLVAAHQAAFEDVAATLKAIAVQPLTLEWAAIDDLVSRCLMAASGNIGSRHVITHLASDLPKIYCDAGKIQEAFLSLIVNACEATTPDDILTVSAWRGFDTVCLAFADSGIGIPDDAQQDIFRMGYTTKPYGSGFGLAYTKQVFERHGGGIQVESTEGGGTVFAVDLPIRPAVSEGLTDLQLRTLPLDLPRLLLP